MGWVFDNVILIFGCWGGSKLSATRRFFAWRKVVKTNLKVLIKIYVPQNWQISRNLNYSNLSENSAAMGDFLVNRGFLVRQNTKFSENILPFYTYERRTYYTIYIHHHSWRFVDTIHTFTKYYKLGHLKKYCTVGAMYSLFDNNDHFMGTISMLCLIHDL